MCWLCREMLGLDSGENSGQRRPYIGVNEVHMYDALKCLFKGVFQFQILLSLPRYIKGSFREKWKGSYRLNALLIATLILLLSFASIRRKLLKTTNTEERSNSERCNHSTRIVNKSFQFQTNHSDITNNSHRLFFDAFVNIWYFIILCTFHFSRNVRKSSASENYF